MSKHGGERFQASSRGPNPDNRNSHDTTLLNLWYRIENLLRWPGHATPVQPGNSFIAVGTNAVTNLKVDAPTFGPDVLSLSFGLGGCLPEGSHRGVLTHAKQGAVDSAPLKSVIWCLVRAAVLLVAIAQGQLTRFAINAYFRTVTGLTRRFLQESAFGHRNVMDPKSWTQNGLLVDGRRH